MKAPSQTLQASGASTRAPFEPERDEARLVERCRALVALAERAGADQAEVFASRRSSVSARFEKGELKLVHVDEGTSLGLRVLVGARQGFTSTNQTSPAALARAAQDALELARMSPPDEHALLPAARPPLLGRLPCDVALGRLAVEDVVLRASELVREITARDARLALDQFALESLAGSQALVASGGALVSESDALCSASVFGMAVDGDDVGGFHYTGDAARTLADFERRSAAASDDFVTTALGNLGAGRAESYVGPVYFSPEAFLSVCVAPIVGGASAIAVQRGRSALGGKLGTSIASSLLSIHDDPSDVSLAGAGRFDREGQPTSRFALVERGVLQGWLYNGYAAAVDGTRSTGHASGGARSLPGLGTHAIVVAPGTAPRAELVRELGRGLFVQRFSGTVDPASGDFSGVAKSARWIEADGSQRPVRETLISGNAFALLQRVLGLSSEQKRCSGSALAPWALVDGVSVTAG